MKLSGSALVDVPRAELWGRLRDPAHLERAVPGCESLEVVEARQYAVVLTTGVASTHGTYRGTVSVVEVEEPDRGRLQIDVAGDPGTVRAEVAVRFADEGGGTVVSYEADVRVTGLLTAVGRRVLAGSVSRFADDLLLALGRPDEAAEPAEPGPVGDEPGRPGVEPGQAGSEPGRAGLPGGAAVEPEEEASRAASRRGWIRATALAMLAASAGAVVRWRSRRGDG